MPTPRLTSAETLPWPGEELVSRVMGEVHRENFYITGQHSVSDIETVLGVVRRTLDSFDTMLDFGSGCGRIMLWLEHLAEKSSLHGVDIDARAVAWAQENIPWATFKVNQPLPPLDYPDGHFDLVFNHSVFTHIDEHYQDLWLAELRRVVRPGGYVLLSIHGEHAFLVYEDAVSKAGGNPDVIRDELRRKGISFIRDDAFVGGPFPDFYHSTFHAPWYIFEHWGAYFDIAAYIVQGSLALQDFVLLRRPDELEPGMTRAARISVAASGLAPPAPAPSNGVQAAPPAPVSETSLQRAGRLLHEGYAVGPAHGRPITALLVEKLVHPVMRKYVDWQRDVNAALFSALWELEGAVSAKTTSGGVPLTELNSRLRDAVRLQGQRINRLETDLWEAVRGPHAGNDQTPPHDERAQ